MPRRFRAKRKFINRKKRVGARVSRHLTAHRPDGKQFFRLRKTFPVVSSSGGVISVQFFDSDSFEADEYSNMVALYEMVRNCAIKVKYFPSFNFNPVAASASEPQSQIYTIYEQGLNSPVSTVDGIIQYENMKLHSLYKPWSIYKKWNRELPSGASYGTADMKGYISTVGTATHGGDFQTQYLYAWATGLEVSTPYGYFIVTYYCAFKNRH
jgi:hypothetical protein